MSEKKHSTLDSGPSTPHSDDEVLVRVEGVSKKFCRSLKKSLWYGVCDIASELNPFGRAERIPKGYKNLTTEPCASEDGPSEIRFALISRANENSWLKSKESAKTFDWPLAFVVQL